MVPAKGAERQSNSDASKLREEAGPLRLPCANIEPLHLELVGLELTSRTRKGLAAPCDLHIDKPGVLNRIDVLCLQQSATNSSSPDGNVLPSRLRDVLVHNDICDLQAATGL